MLTARDAVDDRVAGLDAGPTTTSPSRSPFANCWRAFARWRGAAATSSPRWSRSPTSRSTWRGAGCRAPARTIELTAKEFALLACFVEHRDQVIDRALITAHVWDDNHDPFTNVLEVLVRRLRRKIDDGFEPKLIHTLRGAGYRLGL